MDATTIKETRSFHNFIPISPTKISIRRTNYDVSRTYKFNVGPTTNDEESFAKVEKGKYVAATYDGCWYIGLVAEIDEENGVIKLNFMRPKGIATSFHFPDHEYICWVPLPHAHVVCAIESPTLVTVRGQYHTPLNTYSKISQAWQNTYK